jgi:hypothetical protein
MFKETITILAYNRCLLVASLVAFATLWSVLVGSRPADGVSSGVLVWWIALYSVSIFNLCSWRLSAAALVQRKTSVEPAVYLYQRRQLLLSAVYVLGCGFRAILPRADVQRISLCDSWLSSVMVGRSVATVAEMCFMAQWAILLNTNAREVGSRLGVVISWLLVPLITVAELFSWYAVLTTSYLGNVLEESIWALSASLLAACCLSLWPRSAAARRSFLATALLIGVAYLAFMCTTDIPMYMTRWLADEANGREYLAFDQGLQDVWSRRNVTFDWSEWRTEIPWMSLYLSVAVWCSIALAHVPRLESMLGGRLWQPSRSRLVRQ